MDDPERPDASGFHDSGRQAAPRAISRRGTRRTSRDLGWPAVLAVEITVLVVAALILDFTANWLYAPGNAGISGTSRTDLVRADMSAYERSMFDLPLVAYALLAGAAAMLAIPKAWAVRIRHLSRLDLTSALLALAGVVLLANAAQWIGFQRARAEEFGGNLVEIGEVPWIHATIGIGLVAAGLYGSIRSRGASVVPRWTLLSLLVAGVAVIVQPLIPYARIPLRSGSLVLDLVAIANVARSDARSTSPPDLIMASYVVLWLVLGQLAAIWLLGLAATGPRWVWRTKFALAGSVAVLSAVGMVLGIIGLAQVGSVHADAVRGPNVVAPLAFVVVVVLSSTSLRRNRRET